MTDLYHHLQSHKGKEIIKAGWKAAGITDILQNSRGNNENLIKENPFTWNIVWYLGMLAKKYIDSELLFVVF